MLSLTRPLRDSESALRRPLRLGLLASHSGTNVQALLDAIGEGRLDAEARVVISNNSAARVLERARRAGVASLHLSSRTHPAPGAEDQAIRTALLEHEVELVVLAGYLKKLGAAVLASFARRIVNTHPALLPKYGGAGMYGLRVHQAVLVAGETESGATIHLVDSEYDRGPTLAQQRIAVAPEETPESLQARVLAVEHRLYADTLQRIATGELNLDQPPRPLA